MSTDWLQALEERVHQAADRITALAKENARLAGKLAKAEERLSQAGSDPDSDEARAWAEEREEIRTRVEKLVSGLEELLEETE